MSSSRTRDRDHQRRHHGNTGRTLAFKPIQDRIEVEAPKDNQLESSSNASPIYASNHRNHRRKWRNRHKSSSGPQFVNNSELESTVIEVVCLTEEVESLSLIEESKRDQEGGENEEEDFPTKIEAVEEKTEEKEDLSTEIEVVEVKIEAVEGKIESSESGTSENEVMRVLEELWLGKQEVDLLEEELKSNDQLQEDELLVLESIYGENAFILERQRGLRSVQITIPIETPDELIVTAKLSLSSERVEGEGEGSNEISYSFKVRYLPPLVLTILLPKSYPSHLPPHFSISALWLDAIKLSNLCSMLDSIWTEQPGQEVMYRWVEWLQNYSLSYFGFEKEVILGPYNILCDGDKRAVSGSISIDVDVPAMRRYNEEKCHENFCKSLHECCICFSEYPGSDFIKLSCQHFFCRKCMKTYADIHVAEHTISKLQCPDTKCEGMIPPSLLKELIGDEEYERCESIMLQKALDSMSDVAYCPRCETPCIEEDDQNAQCSKCCFNFCTLCNAQRHVGTECMSPALKLQILQERQNLSSLGAKQKHAEREMINDLLSVTEILRDAKQCPNCKMAISKTEGCNKMVCEYCGRFFCYRCGKSISGYDHFGSSSCELFPQDEIRRWEQQQINVQGARQDLRNVPRWGGQGQICPCCRQFNAKMGNNNHLVCYSCRTNYCCLCKQQFIRCGLHFGPKGCKQHTEA